MPDGATKKLVIRQYSQGKLAHSLHPAEREFRLLQTLQAVGLSVPTPLHLDLSGTILPTPFLVNEYMEGEMLLAPMNLTSYLAQLAAQLAQIHQTKVDALSFLGVSGRVCPELSWAQHGKGKPAWLDPQVWQTLIAAGPRVPQNTAALLHGDFWPGNSLWEGERLVAVIDWEDAILGDPLLDLARGRSEIVWIFGPAAMHQFTDLYRALMPLDDTHLPYWDLCAALRLARLFGDNLADAAAFFHPYGRDDLNEQNIRENYRYFVGQALTKKYDS